MLEISTNKSIYSVGKNNQLYCMLNVKPSEPIQTTIRNHFPFIWIIFNKIQIFFCSSFVDTSMRALVSFFRPSILFLISFREAVFPIECHINRSVFWYVQFSLALCLPPIHYYHCRVHYAITHQCVAITVPSLCAVFFSLYFTSVRVHCSLFDIG